MQLLDDDMDELFRNAASQYPLKTDGSDWDAVMRRLPQSGNKQASAFNRLRDSKWLKWLWGSLLTLLVLIIWLPALKVGVLPPETGNGKTAVTDKNNNITPAITGTNNNTYVTNDRTVANNKNNNVSDNKTVPAIKSFKNNNTISVSGSNPVTAVSVFKINNNAIPETDMLSLHLLSTAHHKEQNISAALLSSGNIILLRKDTAVPPAKTKTKVEKGLYVGIVASPDFSTVKGQKVSNVGYNAGIIAGYRISRHLAVETGVLFERKYYYSEGSYFSTKKINPPADMKIINVDGWCKMIEIPLNVRYVFNIKPKSNWYVNAGVSSYIMSKESYDYKYERYNTVSTRNWSYNNATRNWFSIIHVGVGYEHRLGAVGTLRVEPYLKLPAGGVGIGNLPLTSAGLNIGITRPIRF